MANVAFIRPDLAESIDLDLQRVEPTPRVWAKPLGLPPSIEMRHPNELAIDDRYQRSIDTGPSKRLIKTIAEGWDWRMCAPLIVSRREDGFFVIDGQHRHAAALLRGDIPFLPCCVATYASVADEADMFVKMNRSRRAINRLDDFHAATAGGDESAVAVRAMIVAAGFKVARRTGSQSWVPGEVAFTASIQKVMRKHGAPMCADALTLMGEAFHDQVLKAGGSTFLALTRIALAGVAPDRPRLSRALRTYDQSGWASFLGNTKGTDERVSAIRQALLMAYEEASA